MFLNPLFWFEKHRGFNLTRVRDIFYTWYHNIDIFLVGQQSFLKQVKTKEIFKKNLNITERVQDTLQRDTVSGALDVLLMKMINRTTDRI